MLSCLFVLVVSYSRLGDLVEEYLHGLVEVRRDPRRVDDEQLSEVLWVVLLVELEAGLEHEEALAVVEAKARHVQNRGDSVDSLAALQARLVHLTHHALKTDDVGCKQRLLRAQLRVGQRGRGDHTRLLDVDRSSLLVLSVVCVRDDGSDALAIGVVGAVQDRIDLLLLSPLQILLELRDRRRHVPAVVAQEASKSPVVQRVQRLIVGNRSAALAQSLQGRHTRTGGTPTQFVSMQPADFTHGCTATVPPSSLCFPPLFHLVFIVCQSEIELLDFSRRILALVDRHEGKGGGGEERTGAAAAGGTLRQHSGKCAANESQCEI